MCFYHQFAMPCIIIMQPSSFGQPAIDITSFVKNLDIVQFLLGVHALSGCASVAKLHGIGKATVLKKLKGGHTLQQLGNLEASEHTVVAEATRFIWACYGANLKHVCQTYESKCGQMARKNMTTVPELKCILNIG